MPTAVNLLSSELADEIDEDVWASLEKRLGPVLAKQRLRIEIEQRLKKTAKRGDSLRLENWCSLIELCLKFSGVYWRGRRNAQRVSLRRNELFFDGLPPAFDGFTILQISDLHIELSKEAMQNACEVARHADYDICVLTGDFRAGYAAFESTLEGMAKVRAVLRNPIYGVLGNHDTIRMVPSLEAMGIRMLLNESDTILRSGQSIYVAGIDDAHYHRAHDIERTVSHIPEKAFSILLSHTPEIYHQALHAGFKLLLSGHTHGGQICLPGGIPITLDAKLPRYMGAGAWRYGDLHGYTSVGAGTCMVPVRFNCPAEITLHVLRCTRPTLCPSH
jgi:predicted MPP superfamily phosphohydrolase